VTRYVTLLPIRPQSDRIWGFLVSTREHQKILEKVQYFLGKQVSQKVDGKTPENA
jgi:hypothetical protein